ncbi:hypothetical protein ACFL0V_04220 [Nanoarchaeota archaeon]
MIGRDKLKKEYDYCHHACDRADKLVVQLQQEFARTPQGQEVLHFEPMAEHYLNTPLHFIHDFLPQITQVIESANHFKDKKLAKRLTKLHSKVKHHKLPTAEQIATFAQLKLAAAELKPARLHEFHREFNPLLQRALKLGKNLLALKYNKGKAKNILHLRNLDVEINAWRLLLLRLSSDEDNHEMAPVMGGGFDFSDPTTFEQGTLFKIARVLSGPGASEAKINSETDNVTKAVQQLFPLPRNDMKNFTNLNAFGDAIEKQGKKNIFMKLMLKHFAEKKRAKLFMKEFADGARNVEIVTKIIGLIKKIASEVPAIEMAAKDEFIDLSERSLVLFHKKTEREMKKFRKAISSRMKKLKKQHQSVLLDAEEFRAEARTLTDAMLGGGTVLEDFDSAKETVGKQRDTLRKNATHIYDHYLKVVREIAQLAKGVTDGSVPFEHYQTRVKQLTDYSNQYLVPWIDHLPEQFHKQVENDKNLEKNAKEADDTAVEIVNIIDFSSRRLARQERGLNKELGVKEKIDLKPTPAAEKIAEGPEPAMAEPAPEKASEDQGPTEKTQAA